MQLQFLLFSLLLSWRLFLVLLSPLTLYFPLLKYLFKDTVLNSFLLA